MPILEPAMQRRIAGFYVIELKSYLFDFQMF